MQIEKITKLALAKLKKAGKGWSPDNFEQAFCEEAKRAKFKIDDCNKIENFISQLEPEIQDSLHDYRLKTLQELFDFAIVRINRTHGDVAQKQVEMLVGLSRHLLNTVASLHNKEASNLADSSLKKLSSSPDEKVIDNLKNKWMNFLTTYDDSFLDSLLPEKVDKSDLEKLIKKATRYYSPLTDEQSIDNSSALSLLCHALKPSLVYDEKIEHLSTALEKDPTYLNSSRAQDEAEMMIRRRVELDRAAFMETISTLDGVIEKISSQLINIIETTDGSSEHLVEIKKRLKKTETLTDVKAMGQNLFEIATSLEKESKLLSSSMTQQHNIMAAMQERVKMLEKQLKDAQQEGDEDFLTKLYNRRGFQKHLDVIEAQFKRHHDDYSFVAFDIDFFKTINDKYGHDAGDIVLKSFAHGLKEHSRSEDVVGRLGGEEFLVILPKTKKDGAMKLADKFRQRIEKTKFMYKKKVILVTVSAGVSLRSEHISSEDAIKASDKALYLAKQRGRNQVIPA